MFSNRCVLSDKTITKYMKKGLLIENEIDPIQIQPNSVDLTLGNTWKTLRPNCVTDGVDAIDTKKEVIYDSGYFELGIPAVDGEEASDRQFIEINPGEFILLASREILNIPNGILSFVQGRSSIARLAIQTEQAGLIDAGFRGTITFEVFNQSQFPIILYEGMRIAQVYFFKAQYAKKLYGKEKNSKYKGQIEATGSKIYKDFIG